MINVALFLLLVRKQKSMKIVKWAILHNCLQKMANYLPSKSRAMMLSMLSLSVSAIRFG